VLERNKKWREGVVALPRPRRPQ